MGRAPGDSSRAQVIEVVIQLLESEGYDAAQVRTVVKRARISLATLYKLFPNRDELIVEALLQWTERSVYSRIVHPKADASMHDGLLSLYRQFFGAWQENPRMLEAYHRARVGPGGRRLDAQGVAAMVPIAAEVMAQADAAYAEDVGMVLSHLFDALIARFAAGELSISEIITSLERALARLTSDNAALSGAVRARRVLRRGI